VTPAQLNEAAESCDADEATHVVCCQTNWMLTPPQVRALANIAQHGPWTFTESMSSLDTICTFCASHKPTHHVTCPYALLLSEFGLPPGALLTSGRE
jgi:hypothetical protein